CWAKQLGYNCCRRKHINVQYTDKNGEWGVEDNKWCGIVNVSMMTTKLIDICWSEPDYKCCSKGNDIVKSSNEDGDWGIENGNWCGI
ncbi:Non-catalytic module family DOC2, partial [Piromyces sp. E2]